MTSGRRNRYPSREERRAAEQGESNLAPQPEEEITVQNGNGAARSRVADGKTPTTFHLWEETRYALHTAQWELGMNLSEIGEEAIREYLEREGITVAEPGSGATRRRRRKGAR